MGVWQWVLEHWALVWTYLYVGVDVLLRQIGRASCRERV